MIEARIECMAGEIVSTGSTHLAAIGHAILKLDQEARCKVPVETVCAILEAAHQAACMMACKYPASAESSGFRVILAERD